MRRLCKWLGSSEKVRVRVRDRVELGLGLGLEPNPSPTPTPNDNPHQNVAFNRVMRYALTESARFCPLDDPNPNQARSCF